MILLRLQVADGTTNLYPQAKLYDEGGTLIDTVSLTHVAGGFYAGTSSAAAGNYTARYALFTDAGHTIAASQDLTSDLIVQLSSGTLGLSLQASDGTTTLHPQAKVYDDDAALVDTVNLTHLAGGLYLGTSTQAAGDYSVRYAVFTDAGRTIAADYDITLDEIASPSVQRVQEITATVTTQTAITATVEAA